VTAFGLLDEHQGLYRHTAQAGDLVYASGALGEAAAGLEIEIDRKLHQLPESCTNGSTNLQSFRYPQDLVSRLQYPQPRIELGRALNGIATACLDISDGLMADLGHIAERSNVQAKINCDELYLSDSLKQYCNQCKDEADALDYALGGGDDYELCFTVPPEKASLVAEIANEQSICLTAIGKILEHSPNDRILGKLVTVLDSQGEIYSPRLKSYEHFRRL